MAESFKIPRRPPIPRLLCLLTLVLLSIVSMFSCFMQIFSKYHSSIAVASHQHVRSESPGRWENYESDAEGVDLVAAHGQGLNFHHGKVWSHEQSLRQLLPSAAPGVAYHGLVPSVASSRKVLLIRQGCTCSTNFSWKWLSFCHNHR